MPHACTRHGAGTHCAQKLARPGGFPPARIGVFPEIDVVGIVDGLDRFFSMVLRRLDLKTVFQEHVAELLRKCLSAVGGLQRLLPARRCFFVACFLRPIKPPPAACERLRLNSLRSHHFITP